MNEIMKKTYELIDELEKSNIIKSITLHKNNILNNKNLKELIEKANKEDDEYKLRELKIKLYQYEDYKKYMENYNKLNYIVLEINNRMKKITNDKNCRRI